jgi:GNAT superfamily N-acetyltransferase
MASDSFDIDNREFSCEVLGFHGYEQEILRLRNANRDWSETLEYLRWRYECEGSAPAPRVFWLRTRAGERVGVASVLFRPYWIDNVRTHAAVVGDISLNAAWRGLGLGQRLLQCMTDYLDEHFPEHAAFVIPTQAARRTLARIGWITPGTLVPHVFVLDPVRYLRRVLRSEWLSTQIAGQIRGLVRQRLSRYARAGCHLDVDCALDEWPDKLQRNMRKSGNIAIHDLGPESLSWRYARHPHLAFRFARLTRDGRPRGFLVFEESKTERSCSIYDSVAATPEDLQCTLALFILRALDEPQLTTVRVLLDSHHPWRACLRRLGFIARRPEAVFQVRSRSGIAERSSWCVSLGDKDT